MLCESVFVFVLPAEVRCCTLVVVLLHGACFKASEGGRVESEIGSVREGGCLCYSG